MSKSSTSLMLFLALTLCAGIFLFSPYHNFHGFLSQGDHGRDLYAASAVLRGDLPYKDFWWVYGPLMPFYYAAFFKTLGMNISSVLIGKIILNITTGLFMYLAFARLFSPMGACAAAIWFMTFQRDFFFTYNHAGGIMTIAAIIWLNLSYLRTQKLSYGFLSLAAVFILGLIKINFALCALVMSLLAVGLWDLVQKTKPTSSHKIFYTLGFLGLPLGWFLIYAFLCQGLSVEEIRQCLPYLGGDEPYNKVGPLETIPILLTIIKNNILSSPLHMGFCALIWLCIGISLKKIIKKGLSDKNVLLFLFLLGYGTLFYFLNLHEFFKSGVFYRSFWSQPFSLFLSFMFILFAVSDQKPWISRALWITLSIACLYTGFQQSKAIDAYKNPYHYLGGVNGKVYVGNDPNWIQTVVRTTKHLNSILAANETFLALPYDCLYYYLTNKPSPTRQLIFFDHINIPRAQEESILLQLENKKIATILVSSRQQAKETGLGTFGVSYCPLLAQYINTSFAPTARFGDWTNEPGWAWNHGTIIFRRKVENSS